MLRHHSLGLGLGATTFLLLAAPVLAAAPIVIGVDEWNKSDGSQGLTLNADNVKAGKVTFAVKNDSTDEVHEFLIVKTSIAPDDFPVEVDNPAKIDESKLDGVKELGDIEPGQEGTMSATLVPGTYVVFCNQPGHFMAGMHATLTVTP